MHLELPGLIDGFAVCVQDEPDGLRPRLCHMKKGQSGYGFNLHSEKSRPGQFIRAVDDHSPAQKAGLRPQDKIIQVSRAPHRAHKAHSTGKVWKSTLI